MATEDTPSSKAVAFTGFCLCFPPKLDADSVCTKCGTQWTEEEK